MKRLLIFSLLVALVSTAGFAQKRPADPFYTNTKKEVTCMGSELDGSVMVMSWGLGKSKKDAIKQLEKNALFAVLFDGVRSGREGCNSRPVVTEVNARDRYMKYFNKLFKDGGDYKKYIRHNDSPKKSKNGYKDPNTKEFLYTMIVTVNVPRLEKHLDKDYVTLKNDKKKTIRKNEKQKK